MEKKIRKLLLLFLSVFFILFFSRIMTEAVFKKAVLKLPQVDSMEILEFTYFPCIISEFDIVLTLKNENKVCFEKIKSNLTFSKRTSIQNINDFTFFYHYEGNQAFGLPVFLLEQVYGEKMYRLQFFLENYGEISKFIFNMKNENIYSNINGKQFSINSDAFGSIKFLEETQLTEEMLTK